MGSKTRTLLVLAFLPSYVILAGSLGYLVARLVGSPAVLYSLGRFGIRIALLLAGTRVVCDGAYHLRGAENTVIMPNHASHLDAPVLLQALPVDFKAVAKIELFRIPLLNWCLRFAGFIPVDRSDRSQSQEAISRATESLKRGDCFLIFPEGTRSRNGELGDFKKGGFVVAIAAGSRIVPVALEGSKGLMPRGGAWIRSGTVRVRVLEPVEASAYRYEDRDRLLALVRARITQALAVSAPPVPVAAEGVPAP